MEQLPPDYLAELARQIGFISAFLGGVSATFLVTVATARLDDRRADWIIGCAAAASVAFIISVVATTMLAVTLRPDAPAVVQQGAAVQARALAFLSFLAGMFMLLACVGISGWLRSPKVGRLTAALAVVGFGLVGWSIIG